MGIFQVDYEDIERLNAIQLTDLLRNLLWLETRKAGIVTSSVDVSLKINVPDGGEDGRVSWEGGPGAIPHLPNRLSMFQCKAEKDMSKIDFMNASLMKPVPSGYKVADGRLQKINSARGRRSKSTEDFVPCLKPQVAEILDSRGAYSFFYSGALTKAGLSNRLGGIRDALRITGRADAETAALDIYDANKIALWSNEHLVAVGQISHWIGKDIPFCVQTWESWSGYDEHSLFDFVQDDERGAEVEALSKHLSQEKSVARILGNPGLGKSRLALQALSTDEQLRRSVAYIDAAIESPEIVGVVRQFRHRHDSAIIVVDNCNLELHQQLRKEIMHQESRLTLLSIDFDPGERTGASGPDEVIIVSPMADHLIRAMLKQVFGQALPENELERIVEFSEGYPQMAALIARERLDGKEEAGTLNDDELLDRLLWGRKERSDEAFDTISGCALFARVGFEEEVSAERSFVAEHFARVDQAKFYSHVQNFLERRIIQRRGDFIIVVPAPLAARLSADWWKRCPDERAIELITGQLAGNLDRALCEQIKMLHYLPKVQDITRKLCGESGPFGRPEVLDTKRGSLFFGAFAEVSPSDCANAIDRAFSGWSRDRLLSVSDGRRNIIWALEKMCFWQDSFSVAAKLLLRFAEAENESWSNNATGQFVQLFQLYLSGTQTSFDSRVSILEEALQSPSPEVCEVIVKAAERAFQLSHYGRAGGVEQQGARAAERDYQPKTGQEVIEYWQRCIDVLVSVFNLDSPSSAALAQRGIENIIYSCVQKHFWEPLWNAIAKITAKSQDQWYTARQKLDFALRTSGTVLDDEEKQLAQEIYRLLEPKSLSDRLRMWVVDASWDYLHLDAGGEVVDDSVPEVVRLAEDCMRDLGDFENVLPIFFQGTQRNGYLFGKEVGKRAINISALLSVCKHHLLQQNQERLNVSFMCGLISVLSGDNRDAASTLLDEFASIPDLRKYVVALTTGVFPDAADLKRCVGLLADPCIDVTEFVVLSYGNALASISPGDVSEFCLELHRHSDAGQWTALMILDQYCLNREDLWASCSQTFREIVLKIRLALIQKNIDSVMAGYVWQKTCARLIVGSADPELAEHMAVQIVQVCASAEDRVFFKFDQLLKKMLPDLLKEPYLVPVWHILSEALISDDWRLRLHMQWLLGNELFQSDEDGEPGPLYCLPNDLLFDWSLKSEDAANILARSVPVMVASSPSAGGPSIEVHPLALRLLDQHGHKESFLSELSANIGSFAGWGSSAPRYKARVELFQVLSKHRVSAVKRWAKKNLETAEENLRRAQKVDDEHDAGIFDRF